MKQKDINYNIVFTLVIIVIFTALNYGLAFYVDGRVDTIEDMLNITNNEPVEVIEYNIETYLVKPNSYAYVWSGGVVTCHEYINKSHSFFDITGDNLMDEIYNPTNYPIYCAYKVRNDANGGLDE